MNDKSFSRAERSRVGIADLCITIYTFEIAKKNASTRETQRFFLFFFFWQNIRVACRYMRSRNLLILVCIYVYMYIVFLRTVPRLIRITAIALNTNTLCSYFFKIEFTIINYN